MNGKHRRGSLMSSTKNFTSLWMRAQRIRIESATGISQSNRTAFKNRGGETVFINPPYSKISEWVAKAHHEGTKDNTVVVMLIPARTDTRYFHDYIIHRSEIRFIEGRLHFNGSRYNAPFPSMVVIFRGARKRKKRWHTISN